eukprot:TRINITY_DN4648_c0_g1_i1.p1 TRINITY_DN4648_c0_g1~~TRINITY_DN4648_c0_g1_i1.p1  ORF type:complete len:302 (+),score=66.93 TRINITY_DN4648_c0_g1_i1:64-969(+)
MDMNLDEQNNEIEALRGIFDDKFSKSRTSDGLTLVRVEVFSSPFALTLECSFPKTYPFESAPVFELKSQWLSREQAVEITNGLNEMWEAYEGMPIVFEWVEWIRANIEVPKSSLNLKPTKKEKPTLPKTEPVSVIKQNIKAMRISTKKCPKIVHGEAITDRKSTFQGHCAEVHSQEDIELVMAELLSNNKIQRAYHNMVAYRYRTPSGSLVQDNDDDGENAAGGRMAHLLDIMGVENVIAVVSRWYGGIHLGPDRFKHINNCTRDALIEAGFGDTNTSSSKPAEASVSKHSKKNGKKSKKR